jgi:hypothetical protein
MGGLQIKGSGVFFDIDKFRQPDGSTREYFGPYAWRYEKKDQTAGPERYYKLVCRFTVDFVHQRKEEVRPVIHRC